MRKNDMKRTLALVLVVLAGLMGSGEPVRAEAGVDGAGWRVGDREPINQGVLALNAGKGKVEYGIRGGSPCLIAKRNDDSAPSYLYFDVDDARTKELHGACFVVVEYYDEAIGFPLQLQYDSTGPDRQAAHQIAEDRAGGWFVGSGQWRTAAFALDSPRFSGRQNLKADFRLAARGMAVRSVKIVTTRPDRWRELGEIDPAGIEARVRLGSGSQLIIGGFDPHRLADADRCAHDLEMAAPVMKALGATSHEGYVRWNLCEPEPGRYDWHVYDRFVETYKRFGLKWVPFLLVGPSYVMPDWYHAKTDRQPYVCLEHGQASDIESLWSPSLRVQVANFIRAFCDHYRQSGVIESILLGVTGNFGEAIYPATDGTRWTAETHGPYHSHRGFWAGDPCARASFRAWLTKKYGNSESLGKAWGRPTLRLQDASPFLRPDAPNDRAWLDFNQWYVDSMNDWLQFWLEETRKHFPKGQIDLCTGGSAVPEHGSNFADQCRIAARFGAGVRITNEKDHYAHNFARTRWVTSAARQYGGYSSLESASGINAEGLVARLYNASAAGSLGMYERLGNLLKTGLATENFVRYGSQFQQRQSVAGIAVYYPETFIRLRADNRFLRCVERLRDCLDFDYRSDRQIADGGLRDVKALILLEGNIAEAETWQKILAWVRHGGLLLCPQGMDKLTTVEGSLQPHEDLLGPQASLGEGAVRSLPGAGQSADYRAEVVKSLRALRELLPLIHTALELDGVEDEVFVTPCDSGELVWLNDSAKEVRKRLASEILVLPPHAIVVQKAVP
jgi:hypothetical protein